MPRVFFSLVFAIICCSSVIASTDVNETTTTVPDKFRLCTCKQVDECDAELDRSAVVKDRCVEECQATLDDYQSEMDLSSADLGYMLYPQLNSAMKPFEKCVRDKIRGFCLDGAIEAYVHRPNITKSGITYDGRNEESSQQGPLVDRARAVFVSFRRLEMCFANCRRQQAMLCFERKNCAVYLPPAVELQRTAGGCQNAKKSVYDKAQGYCDRLVKLQVRSLIGVCPLLTNKFYMSQL